jgi:hypothetical protein
MSYSQNNEEAVLIDFFGDKTDGTFLEIGAFHPTRLSNTRALIERGWSGVMVEMSPYALVDLVEAYKDNPRIRIVAGAVTLTPEPPAAAWLVPKDDVADGAITTTETWHKEKWAGHLAAQGRKHVAFTAATISLGEVCQLLPAQVDLVSIDTEGTSAAFALAFPYDRFGVKAAVIEHDGNRDVAQLTRLGFRDAAINAENIIFVR